jgi:carbamoyltransferase
MMPETPVLGLSCWYHDAAAALVSGGRVIAAAQEERFDRRKGSPGFPIHAIDYCLREAGISAADLAAVAFYEKPYAKLERILLSHLRAWPRSCSTFVDTVSACLGDRLILPLVLQRELGFSGEVAFLRHHQSHAASAFFASPFDEAAVLTIDGVGEWATTTMGTGRGADLSFLEELHFPDSLGLLYTAVTTWLGFEALHGEGKVMALADFGEPSFLESFHEMVAVRDDGSLAVDPSWFPFLEGGRMYGPRFVKAFGPAREPGSEITDLHRDMAASLQRFLEEAILQMVRRLHEITGLRRLCLAGGVGLNITATSRIPDETPFSELFIQPAAGDAGGALGSALQVWHAITGAQRCWSMDHARLGPAFGRPAMERALRLAGLRPKTLEGEDLLQQTAERVARGLVVGWFQGRMEFGPRALGSRSILADPRNPRMMDILNERVKHREPFRPYGVSVLEEALPECFEPSRPSPFMLQVARPLPSVRERIPAVVHANGTTRLQSLNAAVDGIYYDLVRCFGDLTGLPMVLNTSFNDRNEPIVCSPEDAVRCYVGTEMDALVMGPFLVEKNAS